MYINHAEIRNFRALQKIDIYLNKFSIIIGENDVGKTSFLYALDKYFQNKKLTDKTDWFKENTNDDIHITLSFKDIPQTDEFKNLRRSDDTIVIRKIFPFDKTPDVKAILDDQSAIAIPPKVLSDWFSSESFHFIPVRRDLAVQFSMTKTALLGKTLRAKMKKALEEEGASSSLTDLSDILKQSINTPKETLQKYLRQQMHNNSICIGFEDLEIDPVEGVKFDVCLSDDSVNNILIQNRGAGTQNNLIIALFRLIAEIKVGKYFIFAMEEPENSLHPKAQRQLLSVIQEISESSQVIVTTHSPVFIDRSKFENNILLSRTSNGNTIAKTFDQALLDQVRTDLGIRASDALLKGGGNCALIVEGNTEEDGFPVFMETLGMSEFGLGVSIINQGGSDHSKTRDTVKLLKAYNIPCVIVLDKDAAKTAEDLERERTKSLNNIRRIFCLSKGTIEDYYPLEIIIDIINKELKPSSPVTINNFDTSLHGKKRLADIKRVMFEHGAGDSIEYLKTLIGGTGTRMMKERNISVDDELKEIFETVSQIINSA